MNEELKKTLREASITLVVTIVIVGLALIAWAAKNGGPGR